MILEIGINWKKIVPYILDAILEIGLGITFLASYGKDTSFLWAGVFLIVFGVVQLIRKVKTFQLSKSHLIIKRPLMPFKFAEVSFELKKIKDIELKRVVRAGPYIKITGAKDGGFMLAMDKKAVDLLENELKILNLKVTRENI